MWGRLTVALRSLITPPEEASPEPSAMAEEREDVAVERLAVKGRSYKVGVSNKRRLRSVLRDLVDSGNRLADSAIILCDVRSSHGHRRGFLPY